MYGLISATFFKGYNENFFLFLKQRKHDFLSKSLKPRLMFPWFCPISQSLLLRIGCFVTVTNSSDFFEGIVFYMVSARDSCKLFIFIVLLKFSKLQ